MWNIMWKSNKRAQAMIELAILGPIVLVTFGIVVTYVAKLNNDQWILMSAFRNALAKAHDTNKITSYGTWDDRRMASVTQPILGDKVTSSGAGTVNWAIPSVEDSGQDPQSASYLKINGGALPMLYEYEIKGKSGVEPTYFTWKNSKVTVNTQNAHTTTNRAAGVGEMMLYKVGNQVFIQGRGHGASRTNSVSDE
jgi:uncharacterized protein (UPF0333 family)